MKTIHKSISIFGFKIYRTLCDLLFLNNVFLGALHLMFSKPYHTRRSNLLLVWENQQLMLLSNLFMWVTQDLVKKFTLIQSFLTLVRSLIFLQKLRKYRSKDMVFSPFKLYFPNKPQCVQIDEVLSVRFTYIGVILEDQFLLLCASFFTHMTLTFA